MAVNPEKMGTYEQVGSNIKKPQNSKAGNYGGKMISGDFGQDSGTVGGSGPARAKSAMHDAKASGKSKISY